MIRAHSSFLCEGDRLVCTLDGDARATRGLLIVSGGNETRAGAWNGQALMAERIAGEGFAVLRFDRRGVADSEGANGGFRASGPDIAAALAAFRELCPGLNRVVALGNCDAASALMLTGGAGFDALVLSNPWTFEDDAADDVPAEQVRAHYRKRLADPAALRRLLTNKVSLIQLFRSLKSAVRPAPPPPVSGLLETMRQGLGSFEGKVLFPVAGRDRTGGAFLSRWDKDDPRIRIHPEATHSFVEPGALDWYGAQVLEALRA
ncbi:hydrolase 1, exosortase A system-associated [Novosphingobium sp. 9]|uniref:hydrolase 1, exosortase A system-associated n=1 Tax=Novosphingobium sp. 9 TaxID=2025349 RepID=UPI0021B6808F|nr:hydrolase 1, exosortase A system-associated [Novosphingobium sp. 9]